MRFVVAFAGLLLLACGRDEKPDVPREEAPAPVETRPPVQTSPTSTATTLPPQAEWWDKAWGRRIKIAIDNSAHGETFTDFPVRVVLDAARVDLASIKKLGDDVRFVDADQKPIPHEIESWNPAGKSVVWVRVPKIAGSSKTDVIWLYYANAAAPAPAGSVAKEVWPRPFSGVWHLAGNTKDSSPNGFDGVKATGDYVDGAIGGKALHLNAALQQHVILKPYLNMVGGASAATFSAWINPGASAGGTCVLTLGKPVPDGHESIVGWGVYGSGGFLSWVSPHQGNAGFEVVVSPEGQFPAGQWSYMTSVVDLGNKRVSFYKNGKLIGAPVDRTFSQLTFVDQPSKYVAIGTEEREDGQHYDGSIDELRIERGGRSPGWIAAQYDAMTSPTFLTYGADEALRR